MKELIKKGIKNPQRIPWYLSYKFDKIGKNPISTIKRRRYENNCKNELKDRGLASLMNHLEVKNSAYDPYDIQYSAMLNLYDLTRQTKPSVIFEFGSGYSTFIFAKALSDNYAENNTDNKGKIYSMESEKKWRDNTSRVLPDELSEYCEVVYSPVTKERYENNKVFRYEKVPDVKPDMMYVDGPVLNKPEWTLTINPLSLTDQFNFPFLLIIDGRIDTANFLHEHIELDHTYWEIEHPFKNRFTHPWTQRFLEFPEAPE